MISFMRDSEVIIFIQNNRKVTKTEVDVRDNITVLI